MDYHVLSAGFHGEEHQTSHQAGREIHYAGCKILTPTLNISLQHQNSAVIPPADTHHPPLPGLALLPALLPLALILSFIPSWRSPAQHHIPAKTCTLTQTLCLSPPPFPLHESRIQSTQAPVFL